MGYLIVSYAIILFLLFQKYLYYHNFIVTDSGMFPRVTGLLQAVVRLLNEDRNVLVICQTQEEASTFLNFIENIFSSLSDKDLEPVIIPYDEYEPFLRISAEGGLVIKKISALADLIEGQRYNLIILPVKALVAKTIPIDVLRENILVIKKGTSFEPRRLVEILIHLGYSRESQVDMRGGFSLRGEVLDLFAHNQRFPARLIFFGNRIERMRYYDVETQRGFVDIEEYRVLPSSEFILDDIHKNTLIENIKATAGDMGIPSKELKEFLSKLDISFGMSLMEHYLPFLYNYRCSSILDYIKGAVCDKERLYTIVSSKDLLKDEIHNFYLQIRRNYDELVLAGEIVPPVGTMVTDIDEIIKIVDESEEAGRESDIPDIESLIARFKLYIRRDSPIPISEIRDELLRLFSTYQRVVFLSSSGEQGREFSELLDFLSIPFSREGCEKRLLLRDGDLKSAIVINNILFLPVSLFIREKRLYDYGESAYEKIKRLKARFSEFRIGDYVVHKDFGVGIYRGLKKISAEGGVQDFIIIEYKDGRLLYLPALNIDLISKYESQIGRSPPLSPLGKEQWQKKKLKIKEELLRFASEILRIRAQRRMIKKEPIKDDGSMYEELISGFEYEETPDQLRTMDEVDRDLKNDFPMERIVCGDVGFGKTEIIIRAAFLVANSGGQVAILVPTTILAEQHYYNFRKRLEKFPIRVEMLSRFVPLNRQREIIKNIKEGRVDIVIGTHKIFEDEVQFRDIRLLVIDEEQRFGVEQKEKIKRQNPACDILITTATPIPRTLHMGFSGLIDLSVLTTPPQGRIPVRTIISRFDEEVIRNAIYKEISRGGQVFFVHPRIASIDAVSKKVAALLSDIRVAVVHGRMEAERIENVMHDFFKQRYDLLISTNIIGSGLDFPNVNTIIINGADLFGLTELYQLRGRVGRSNRNAYAYFLFPTLSNLPSDLKRKIDILYRHQGLGAGFNIATEDLEMRGAGELLGKRQAGFIDSIGFDLYQELLQDAISELNGIPLKNVVEPQIRIDLPVYIPDNYIDDITLRLNFYHRFSVAGSETVIEELLAELKDRFSDYPVEVENLARLSKIKVTAREMMIRSIEQYRESISVIFDARAAVKPDKIVDFMHRYSPCVKITPDSKIIIRSGRETGEDHDIFKFISEWLKRLRDLL